MAETEPTVEAQTARQRIAAAMDLRFELNWDWAAIAAALSCDETWIRTEVDKAVMADMAQAGPVN